VFFKVCSSVELGCREEAFCQTYTLNMRFHDIHNELHTTQASIPTSSIENAWSIFLALKHDRHKEGLYIQRPRRKLFMISMKHLTFIIITFGKPVKTLTC